MICINTLQTTNRIVPEIAGLGGNSANQKKGIVHMIMQMQKMAKMVFVSSFHERAA
jgi:hypothetical protein